MIFKKYTVYENKLSEQVSDDNPLKQKLIDMETPTDKHPVYSFLSIGLLLYVWMFLIALVYNRAYGYQLAIAVVLFTTFCFAIVYKKPYLIPSDPKYKRNLNIIIVITILFSIAISITDSGNLPFRDLGKVFLFFLEKNSKSYIAISILSFFSLGIALTYTTCSYEVYKPFYVKNIINNSKIPVESSINMSFFLSILSIIIFIPFIKDSVNPTSDSFAAMLKRLSMVYFLLIPSFICSGFKARKYIKTFNEAKKLNKQGE